MADETRRHIFLAPHYDDVALSCGGTVAKLVEMGRSATIVTIFGGTPSGSLTKFASDMHQRWGVGPGDAVAMRQEEERCAETTLGAESIWLEYLDAIYRDARYNSDPDIFGEVHPDETGFDIDIVSRVTGRVGLSSDQQATWYVPLALGNHVDHQHALSAGRRLVSQGYEVWAYEDFPYAGDPEWRETIRERVEQETTGELRLERLSSSQLERRVRAVLCYRSQLDIIFRHQGDPAASTRRYASFVGDGNPAERFWRL